MAHAAETISARRLRTPEQWVRSSGTSHRKNFDNGVEIAGDRPRALREVQAAAELQSRLRKNWGQRQGRDGR